jgi:hypothetical protein
MFCRRASAGSAGYDAVQASSTRSVHPAPLAASTAAAISRIVAIPVDITTAFPVRATSRISGRSTISALAVL